MLATVTSDLLAAAAPEVRGQLTQLAAALLAARRPHSALRWLRRSGGGQILASLAAGREPITHALLDQMPPSPQLHFLRDRLVVTGILAERQEYLDRIPAWTSQLVTGKPAAHARMIRAYAQWDALRRARRTTRPTPGQAQAVRTKIRTASAFLDWLAARGGQLAALSQPDLDIWIFSHRPDERAALRPFLSWAQQRHLCDRELAIPGLPSTEPDIRLDGDQRWQQLRTCLTDDTIPLAARASAAVALLYGAPLSQVLQLHIADVATISGRCHLRLGQHPVLVPPAIARLLRQQAATAATQPTAPEASRWVFPGQPGLRPVPPAAIVTHLNQHGIHIRAGRTAALIDLAGQLPPPSWPACSAWPPATAERWSRRIASDWATYLHARTRALSE